MRIYGIRHWIEQGYKQVKDELGWADFQVRSDIAIRRHQALVNCAFSFCWDAWFTAQPPPRPAAPRSQGPAAGERGPGHAATASGTILAAGAARSPRRLTPWIALQRWWPAWSKAPPPAELKRLVTAAAQVTACTSTPS